MSLRTGLLTTILVQLCNILYGLVLPRMLILNYGSEVNGIVAGALQLVSLIALLEAGLSAASIRQLYAPLAQRNAPMVGLLLGSVKHYYLQVAGWAAGVGLLAGVMYALFMNSTLAFVVILLVTWFVILGPIIDFALNSKYQVYFVASQGVSKFQVAQLATTFYKILVVLICARLEINVVAMLALLALGPLLKWSTLLALFRTEPFKIESCRPPLPVEQRGSVFGHQLLGSIVFSTPVLYLGILVGTDSTSVFFVNNMVFGIAYTFLSIVMGQVVAARFGHLYASGRLPEVGSLTNKTITTVVGGAFVMMASSVILLPSFLGLYLGELGGGYHSAIQTSLFALWGFFNMAKVVHQTVINAAGLFRDTLWISVVEALVFLGVLIVGYQHASILLVLVALLSSCLIKGILLWLFVHLRIVRLVPEVVLAMGFCTAALLGVCFGVVPAISADSIMEWAVKAALVVFPLTLVGLSLVWVSWGISRFFQLLKRRRWSWSL